MRAQVQIESVWTPQPKTLIVLVNCGGHCPHEAGSEQDEALQVAFESACRRAWEHVQRARVYEAALSPGKN